MPDVMAVPRLVAGASGDEVEDALRSAGCAIVERLAPPDLLERIEAELEPYLAATAPGGDDFAGRNTRRTGALIARSPAFRRSGRPPARAGRARPRAGRPRDELPAASDADDRHRAGRTCAARAPRPVGVRLLRVPSRLRGRVPHDVGAEEFTEENGATRVIPGSHTWADRLRPDTADTIAAEMPQGLGAALRRLALPRRGREPLRRAAPRHQRGIHALVAAPRGEPVPRVPARGRARARPSWPDSSATERGAYALGYFGDLRDPMEALHGYDDRPPRFAPDV